MYITKHTLAGENMLTELSFSRWSVSLISRPKQLFILLSSSGEGCAGEGPEARSAGAARLGARAEAARRRDLHRNRQTLQQPARLRTSRQVLQRGACVLWKWQQGQCGPDQWVQCVPLQLDRSMCGAAFEHGTGLHLTANPHKSIYWLFTINICCII